MRWAQSISEPSLPPSPQPLDASNNLATGQFASQAHWETYNNSSTSITDQDVNAMGDIGVSAQRPYATTPGILDSDLKIRVGYPTPVENIHTSPSHATPTPTGQINLATSSNFESCMRSTVPAYYHPTEFSPYDQNAYSQYSGTFSENRSEGAETSANAVSPGFAYGYAQPPSSVQPGCDMIQVGQSYAHGNFGCGDASLPNTQALNELYLSSEHANSFPTEYPANAPFSSADTFLERRALAMNMAEPQVEPTFVISFNGMPLGEDAWSSVAVSSPSLASYNSSPRASIQHDASALGTPVLEYEDASSPVGEPLLTVSHSMPELRRASSSSITDSISRWSQRDRRGVVGQRGRSMPSSQADSSSQPMLNAVVASHLYADEFGSDNGADPFGVPHPVDDGYASAFSPTTPEADSPPKPSAPVRPSLRSTSRNPATDSATDLDSSHSGQELPTKAERGTRGQSSGPRHHPYGRSTRMTAHEQVIQFDAPSVGSSDDVSDDQETSTRKKKKSKASKRCYCDYVCPIKGEPCGQSVSREADMSRHLQRHRRAEQDMVRDGILASERQTVFDKLKSSEEVVCLGCGQHISRKDAFKRHLKNTGKACRPFYPEIVIVDRDD